MITIEQAREWYPEEDAVHGFDHVLRVLAMAERLGQVEGADLEIVRAAVLLHDAQPGEGWGGEAQRANHHLSSAEFAGRLLRQEGWGEERIAAVQHCIRAHRFRDEREQPETLEAKILFDADKLDAIGAIGAARAVAYAAQHGQPAYAQPSARFLERGQGEVGEVHSAYHEFVFKLARLKDRLFTPSARAIGEARHRYLEEFYFQLGEEISGRR